VQYLGLRATELDQSERNIQPGVIHRDLVLLLLACGRAYAQRHRVRIAHSSLWIGPMCIGVKINKTF